MSDHPCPVCTSLDTESFFRRSAVPIHENMVYATQRAARDMPRGEMDLHVCQRCGFAFNPRFDQAKMQYSEQYDNTQTHSATFNEHVERTVRQLVHEHGVRNCTIVEVGCGKGDFIRRLVELEGSGNRGFGVDPTYEGPLSVMDGRLRFERRYYAPDCDHITADVAISRHMIEHVPDPVGLFRTVHQAMADSPRGRFFLETRDVAWALRTESVWDLIYEGCSYFNATSLANAFGVAGFRVDRVGSVFDGQYLLAEATRLGDPSPAAPEPGEMPTLAEAFGRQIAERLAAWKAAVESLETPVAIWGAGSKGMTFGNIVDPDCRAITCAVDVNPRKQGAFLPGTGHPILAPAEVPAAGVRTVLVMNPNYRDEIAGQLTELNCDARVMNWTELG